MTIWLATCRISAFTARTHKECSAWHALSICLTNTAQEEPRIHVQSEDEPERMLLETKITKDDGYQKQQGPYRGTIYLILARSKMFAN
jgi:hypothetical protein